MTGGGVLDIDAARDEFRGAPGGRSGGGRRYGGTGRHGQEFPAVVEQHDTVAQQRPPLLRVAGHRPCGRAIGRQGVRAPRPMPALPVPRKPSMSRSCWRGCHGSSRGVLRAARRWQARSYRVATATSRRPPSSRYAPRRHIAALAAPCRCPSPRMSVGPLASCYFARGSRRLCAGIRCSCSVSWRSRRGAMAPKFGCRPRACRVTVARRPGKRGRQAVGAERFGCDGQVLPMAMTLSVKGDRNDPYR